MPTETISTIETGDLELVSASLAGDRDAFGRIVARYQNLICSLAYSATGNLSQSQDVAQETFVIAWKKLSDLREPGKLRAWLCGIARNRIHKTLGKQSREPLHAAESLEAAEEVPSNHAIPSEQAITKEEEAILWRSLERIPENYREPLILFYREHQSIENVAAAMDLSEDAVKQRLSRGRKLLHEQVLAFVEGALEKTSPGKTFAFGVLAALPMTVTSAKAAVVGITLARGGAAAKSATMIGSLGGLFAMIGGAYVSLRVHADEGKSPRERRFLHWMIGIRLVAVLLTMVAFYGMGRLNFFDKNSAQGILNSSLVFVAVVVGTAFFAYCSDRQRQIQIEDGTFAAPEWNYPRKETDSLANPTASNSNKLFTATRFMAFGLVLFVMMMAQAPWKQHLSQALLMLCVWILILSWSFRHWQNRPRYQSPRSGWTMTIVAFIGLLTLLFFNLHQYGTQAGLTDPRALSPKVVTIFNVTTVFAYGSFIGILAWMRKALIRSQHNKSC